MNHQELSIFNASLSSFFKPIGQFLADVSSPKLFSGWPYFILLLAALAVGSLKVSSLDSQADAVSSARPNRKLARIHYPQQLLGNVEEPRGTSSRGERVVTTLHSGEQWLKRF